MYLCILKFGSFSCKQQYMLETITKGFIIGLLVSAPMGPINMLVIQRTLNRGWWHGIVTGFGAILSDLVYMIITLIGLSFVSVFLDEYAQIITVLGSIVLFVFGMLVYRSNPLRDWTPNRLSEETRYVKDFFSSFLLTISNVTIVLVLMGLYAHLSFNPLAHGSHSFVVVLLGFSAAALLWWLFITTMVSRLRKHFNRRGLVLLNRIVGTVLMLLGAGRIILLLFPKHS